MVRIVKQLAVFLLLGAFILPSTGFLLFVHQCQTMGKTQISVDGYSACCGKSGSHMQCSLIVPSEIHKTHQLSLQKETCCRDTHLFVKVNTLVQEHRILKLLKDSLPNYLPVNSAFTCQSISSVPASGTYYISRPPGNAPNFAISVLRL